MTYVKKDIQKEEGKTKTSQNPSFKNSISSKVTLLGKRT
jgi:hypothetical protein